MSFKKSAIITILFFALLSTAKGDDAIYRSEHYILTNPRITCGGGEARSEHYTLTNVQIGNIAGGKAKSERYTIEAFPVTSKLPPKPPNVNPPITPTNDPDIALSGTKDKNTSIQINGYEVIPITPETTWNIPSYNIGEEEGQKILSVTSKNKYNLESPSTIVNITLDITPPAIHITLPSNGVAMNEAPITVTGTINEPSDVIVNGMLANVSDNAFTADNIDLRKGENIIKAIAYDLAGNYAEDTITVTSNVTSDYNLTKITKDTYKYDPTNIIAGSQAELTVKLEIDGEPAAYEPIQFQITQGNGSLPQPVVNTNSDGIATGILITDTSADATNLIEVFDQNYPSKKVTFHIDTKEGSPSRIIKLTDENIHPVPGASIELIARLVDSNNNPIPEEEVTFQIVTGGGSLLLSKDITKNSGEARTTLTTQAAPNASCTVQAKCSAIPNVTANFVIQASGLLTVTLEDIDAKVSANNSKIKDITADIHVTSNAPWLAPETQLKIWRKGRQQKVQEISPKPGVYIKPMAKQIESSSSIERQIIAYDSAANIYTIEAKKSNQAAEYPCEISYVDFNKGVVVKVEYYTQNEHEGITKYTKISSDYTFINDAWIFQTLAEEWSSNTENMAYATTSTYSSVVINSGIPNSIFE